MRPRNTKAFQTRFMALMADDRRLSCNLKTVFIHLDLLTFTFDLLTLKLSKCTTIHLPVIVQFMSKLCKASWP